MQLAPLQLWGLDFLIYFPQLAAGPSPSDSLRVFVGAAAGRAQTSQSGLRALLPLLGSPERSGPLVIGLPGINHRALHGEGGGQLATQAEEERPRKADAFASFCHAPSLSGLILTPEPRCPHLLNGCEQWGSVVPRVRYT